MGRTAGSRPNVTNQPLRCCVILGEHDRRHSQDRFPADAISTNEGRWGRDTRLLVARTAGAKGAPTLRNGVVSRK